VLIWAEQFELARALLEREIAGARELQDLFLLGYALPRLAELEARVGRLQAAHRAAGEAVEVTEQTGLLSQRASALTRLAWVQALLGREEQCREFIAAARATGATNFLDIEARRRFILGLAALGAGRPADAVADLAWSDDVQRRGGVIEPGMIPVTAELAEAYARLGRPDDAIAVIERLEAMAERTGRLGARVAAARCRALLADDGELDTVFGPATALAQRATPMELARTRLAYGQRLRRAKRRREAREQLRAALELFDEAGAAGWAAQCRADLTATGLTAVRTEDDGVRLTPQEWQIALSVADGLTNREIATRVFLSPKTVEYHLGNVYRKLGLHSRRELMRRLADRTA
jgi:DNA-binding CsgD family transcriptional regulator